MAYETYKLLHYAGLMLLFFGLSGALTLKMAGVAFTGPAKKLAFMSHGIGLFLMLLGGFGMLARLGIAANIPGWVYAKMVIWLVLGGSIALAKRKGQIGWPLMILFVGLGVTAAWLALTKPF